MNNTEIIRDENENENIQAIKVFDGISQCARFKMAQVNEPTKTLTEPDNILMSNLKRPYLQAIKNVLNRIKDSGITSGIIAKQLVKDFAVFQYSNISETPISWLVLSSTNFSITSDRPNTEIEDEISIDSIGLRTTLPLNQVEIDLITRHLEEALYDYVTTAVVVPVLIQRDLSLATSKRDSERFEEQLKSKKLEKTILESRSESLATNLISSLSIESNDIKNQSAVEESLAKSSVNLGMLRKIVNQDLTEIKSFEFKLELTKEEEKIAEKRIGSINSIYRSQSGLPMELNELVRWTIEGDKINLTMLLEEVDKKISAEIRSLPQRFSDLRSSERYSKIRDVGTELEKQKPLIKKYLIYKALQLIEEKKDELKEEARLVLTDLDFSSNTIEKHGSGLKYAVISNSTISVVLSELLGDQIEELKKLLTDSKNSTKTYRVQSDKHEKTVTNYDQYIKLAPEIVNLSAEIRSIEGLLAVAKPKEGEANQVLSLKRLALQTNNGQSDHFLDRWAKGLRDSGGLTITLKQELVIFLKKNISNKFVAGQSDLIKVINNLFENLKYTGYNDQMIADLASDVLHVDSIAVDRSVEDSIPSSDPESSGEYIDHSLKEMVSKSINELKVLPDVAVFADLIKNSINSNLKLNSNNSVWTLIQNSWPDDTAIAVLLAFFGTQDFIANLKNTEFCFNFYENNPGYLNFSDDELIEKVFRSMSIRVASCEVLIKRDLPAIVKTSYLKALRDYLQTS